MALEVTHGLDHTENAVREDPRRLPPVDGKDWRTVANIRVVKQPIAEPVPAVEPRAQNTASLRTRCVVSAMK